MDSVCFIFLQNFFDRNNFRSDMYWMELAENTHRNARRPLAHIRS